MQTNLHPQYYSDAQVVCVCGNTFTTGSTKPQIKVEICAACHPFYTGTQKFVDSVGNVQKFQDRQKAAAIKQATLSTKKKKADEDEHRPRTLREMLQGAK